MTVFPKVIYRFSAISIKILFFYKNRKADSKIHVGLQGVQNSQKILKKKNKFGGFTLPDFKT